MPTPSLSDPDAELFLVMLDALDRIATYIEGYDQARYFSDQKTIDATALNFVVLGECARRLSPQAKLIPIEPWIKMAGLRHRIAHGYASVDPALLWETAAVHASALRPKIAAMLGMV